MPSVNAKTISDPSLPADGAAKPVADARARDVPTWALPPQSLKRTGLRPLTFNGPTIATVCGVTPALPYWYELNVHRTAAGAYVSDIRLFRKHADKPDLFRVTEHADLEALVDHMEDYDPSGDLDVPADLLEGSASSAAIALRTAWLQMEINRITDHYRSMACQLFAAVIARTA